MVVDVDVVVVVDVDVGTCILYLCSMIVVGCGIPFCSFRLVELATGGSMTLRVWLDNKLFWCCHCLLIFRSFSFSINLFSISNGRSWTTGAT